jgi:hypothetical protein
LLSVHYRNLQHCFRFSATTGVDIRYLARELDHFEMARRSQYGKGVSVDTDSIGDRSAKLTAVHERLTVGSRL